MLAALSVVVGATMLLLFVLLRWRARRYASLEERLIALNQQAGFEAEAFLNAAWPILQQAGVTGLCVRWHWFGVAEEQKWGQAGQAIEHTPWVVLCDAGDIRAELVFDVAQSRGEERYFLEQLAETVRLLVLLDIWRHVAAVRQGFGHWNRTATLLMHDVKNLAQFVRYLSALLPPADTERRAVMAPLARALPAANARAERVLAQLSRLGADEGSTPAEPPEIIALSAFLQTQAEQHGVKIMVQGEAHAKLPPALLAEALTEIFDNCRTHGQAAASVSVRLASCPDLVEITLLIPTPEAVTPAELRRWFEPFYSGNRQGLGLGLFQARLAIESCGGMLSAEPAEGGVNLSLRLPAAGL